MIIDVMDLKLRTINLTKNYDDARNAKAKRIYNNAEVEVIKVEKLENEEGENYKITANVDRNYDTYIVNLKLHNNTLEKYSCTCPDYEKGNLCKHILATCMETIEPHFASTEEGMQKIILLEKQKKEERIKELRKQQEEARRELEYRRKYSDALQFIEEYKDINLSNNSNKDINIEDLYEKARLRMNKNNKKQNNTELATQVKIEPRVSFKHDNSSIDVTFKIGQTAMYSLKNIVELKDAFNKEEIIDYGKKLRFYAKRENFCNDDHKLLDYILNFANILKYQEIIQNESYYRTPSISTKTIKIYEDKIDEFFDIIKDRKVIFEDFYHDSEYYTFSDEKFIPKFNIKKEKDGDYSLKLNISEYKYIISQKNIYIFYKQKVYTIDKKENSNLIQLLHKLRLNDEILIPKDKMNEFSTYVVPKIDKYMIVQTDNKKAREPILVNKLACKLLLDLDENEDICLNLKFCYLDHEFNILDNEYKKYVQEKNIIRNIPEERVILTRLFNDGFELEPKKNYFVLKNLDYTYEFLSEKIQNYMNDFEVLVTDKFKNKKVKKPKVSSLSVKLNNGLLEIDMSKIDIDIKEIKNILQNYNVKKKYYRLQNGDFLNLEKSEDLELLNDISNNLDVDFSKLNKELIKLPVNRSVYLEKLLDKNKSISATKNDDYNKLVNNIGNKNFSEDIKISKNFENILRSYQKTGYKWLKVLDYYKFGGILADDMGLGKTLQIIALLESTMKEKNKKPSIVVAPSSLVLNWKAEVEKWCKELKVVIIKGDASSRKELIESYNQYDLVITSYDLLKRDVLEYENKVFRYIIADEAQYIKNFSTQNATALKSLEGEVKYALTGTPLENSISELWSIFDFIMPRLFV